MRLLTLIALILILISCGDKTQVQTNTSSDLQIDNVAFGKETNLFNATVALKLNYEGKLFGRCSGTIISPTEILTAAHCVGIITSLSDKEQKITYNYQPDDIEINNQSGLIDEIVHNDLFENNLYTHDMALLILKKPLDVSKILIPELATPDDEECLLKNKCTAVAAVGFGVDENSVMQNDPPRKVVYLTDSVAIDRENGLLCFPKSSKGIRKGDSGGSLYILNNNRLVLIGIPSLILTTEKEKLKKDPITIRRSQYFTRVTDAAKWTNTTRKIRAIINDQNNFNANKNALSEIGSDEALYYLTLAYLLERDIEAAKKAVTHISGQSSYSIILLSLISIIEGTPIAKEIEAVKIRLYFNNYNPLFYLKLYYTALGIR